MMKQEDEAQLLYRSYRGTVFNYLQITWRLVNFGLYNIIMDNNDILWKSYTRLQHAVMVKYRLNDPSVLSTN